MVLGQGCKGKRQKPKSFVTLMQTSAKRNSKNSKKKYNSMDENYYLKNICWTQHPFVSWSMAGAKISLPFPLPSPLTPNPPPFSPFSQPPLFPFHPIPLPFPPPFFPIPYAFDTFYAGYESTSFPGSTSYLWVTENPGYEVQTKWGTGTRYRSIEDGNLTLIKEKHV